MNKSIYHGTFFAFNLQIKINDLVFIIYIKNNFQNTKMQNHADIKKSILNKISQSDYMHMAYLRPIQLVLKQMPSQGGKKELPKGLLYVNRASCQQNQEKHPTEQFALNDLQTRLKDGQIQQQNSQFRSSMAKDYLDNLLFHMMLYKQIEMCICICMYNESKDMLDNTLSGVGQNIYQLASKHKVNPDKIAVIILADGMGKISSSIIDWSQMMLKQSGMFLSDDVPLQTLEQMKQERQNNRTSNLEDDDEDQMRNYNNILFDPIELQMRKKERFSQKKKQYDQVVKLLDQVTKMLQEKITPAYQRLPARAKDIFVVEAKKEYKNQNGQSFEESGKNKSIEEYVEKNYLSNKLIGPNLIRNTLTQTKLFCNRYINSRDPITHVSFYRTSKYFSKEQTEQRKSNNQLVQEKDDQIKMNIFFCAKYKNAQKLSSHNWFFNGFCRQLNPKYAILLDVGLRPDRQGLCKMYTALSNDQKLGGVCGYMGLKIQKADPIEVDFVTQIMHYFVDIQRAQQMEYHFAHIIDKPFQSWFNFIHVLPGAYSGYSMKAIWGEDNANDSNLLREYFKSINDKIDESSSNKDSDFDPPQVVLRTILPTFISDCFYEAKNDTQQKLMYDENVYLAQDRILCMKIHQNGYKLQYLPDAFASVDPMKSLQDLLGQRKRWINGSFFAFSKVKKTLSESKECCNDIGLKFQTYYLSFMNVLGFVAPALFLFTVYIAMQAFKADVLVTFLSNLISPDSEIYNCFVLTMNFIYVMLIGGLVLYSVTLTNKNQKFVSFVYGVSTIMGILSLIVFVVLFVDLIRGLSGNQSFLISNIHFTEAIPGGQSTIDILRYIILYIIGLYAFPVLFASVLFRKASILFQILLGVLSFVFYTPTYVSILNIYALCRMDDLSWGTKGLQTAGSNKNQEIQDFWKTIKIIHVAKFVFWNVVVGGLLLHFGDDFVIRFWITFAIMILIGSTMTIKVVIAIMYYIQYWCCASTKTLNTGVASSQTLNQRFDKIKKHYVQSINQNIDDLINNIKEGGRNVNINQNTLLNSRISRIYMNSKKLQGMKAKNQMRVQKSKIIKSVQSKEIKNIKYLQPQQIIKQVDSPDKKSQNSDTEFLLNEKKVHEEMVEILFEEKKQKPKIQKKPLKPLIQLRRF